MEARLSLRAGKRDHDGRHGETLAPWTTRRSLAPSTRTPRCSTSPERPHGVFARTAALPTSSARRRRRWRSSCGAVACASCEASDPVSRGVCASSSRRGGSRSSTSSSARSNRSSLHSAAISGLARSDSSRWVARWGSARRTSYGPPPRPAGCEKPQGSGRPPKRRSWPRSRANRSPRAGASRAIARSRWPMRSWLRRQLCARPLPSAATRLRARAPARARLTDARST